MKSSDNSSAQSPLSPSGAPRSRFALTGPSQPFDPRTDAVRPDIADIRLADRFFAPHYAAPLCHAVVAPVTLSAARDGCEPIAELSPGDAFEALEILRDAAWGIARPAGLVGYVALSALGPVK